jgi:hypothetical protein
MNIQSIAGTIIWLAAWAALRLPLEVAILLFAPLVLVPIGLSLIAASGSSSWEALLLAMARRIQLPAAIALALSFAFDQGSLAATLAAPWLAVTLLLAAACARRLVGNGLRFDATTAEAAALLFIPVGGGWAVISRAGLRPQDFSQAIVLLTAVHFHYAGFVLPLIAACTARRLQQQSGARPLARIDALMLLGIVLGVPAVGIGISLSPHVEVCAAIALALACVILAIRQIQAALTTGDPTQVTLASVSSLSLAAAMVFAAVYALGEFTGQRWLEIPTMIRTHGAFNAFGFAACGIAAWKVNRSTPGAGLLPAKEIEGDLVVSGSRFGPG